MVIIETKEFSAIIRAYRENPDDYEERTYEILFKLAEYVYNLPSYHFECPEKEKYHMICEIADQTMSRIKWLQHSYTNVANFFIKLIGCDLRQRKFQNAKIRQR